MSLPPIQKPAVFVGPARKELLAFPRPVRRAVGQALDLAQRGLTHERVKVLSGYGGRHVLEIRDDDASGTYRTVYTTKFDEAVYALCAFQKKSTRGIATPRRWLDLIAKRIADAERLHEMLTAGEAAPQPHRPTSR